MAGWFCCAVMDAWNQLNSGLVYRRSYSSLSSFLCKWGLVVGESVGVVEGEFVEGLLPADGVSAFDEFVGV